jgi:Phytanoyl-CoA dioxygenase (PhyH)
MKDGNNLGAGGRIREQRREFDETGLLHLPSAIAEPQACAMRENLWAELASKYHFRPDAPEAWREGPVFGLQHAGRKGGFGDMMSPALCAALDDLFAPDGWERPAHWGTPLVTFPFRGRRWEVPNQTWHLDVYGGLGVQRALGEVTVFAFLDSVSSQGGATVAVVGTHRLIQEISAGGKAKIRSADGRRLLAETHPWLRDLWSQEFSETRRQRLMEEGAVVRGVPVKVVEITGKAGDIVVMHSSVLHTPSLNCSSKPRMVVRQGVYRAKGRINS